VSHSRICFSGRPHDLLGTAERRGSSCRLRRGGRPQLLQFCGGLSPRRVLRCGERFGVSSGICRHVHLLRPVPWLSAPPTPSAPGAARRHARPALCVSSPGVGLDASSRRAVRCQGCGRPDVVDRQLQVGVSSSLRIDTLYSSVVGVLFRLRNVHYRRLILLLTLLHVSVIRPSSGRTIVIMTSLQWHEIHTEFSLMYD
jgi:hypothetical protein